MPSESDQVGIVDLHRECFIHIWRQFKVSLAKQTEPRIINQSFNRLLSILLVRCHFGMRNAHIVDMVILLRALHINQSIDRFCKRSRSTRRFTG